MPNWLKVERRAHSIPNVPMVGIQARGNLSLNRAAMAALGDPDAVELLYDPDEQLIGIRPVQPSAAAYPVNKSSAPGAYLIAGKALMAALGLETGVARRYDATMVDGVLTVDLKQEGAPSGRGAR